MNASKLAVIAITALIVTAGAAVAMPGNAPEHAAADENERASDQEPDDAADARSNSDLAADENASAEDTGDNRASGPDERAAAQAEHPPDSAAASGPPVDLPDQVPDHVTTIHELIVDFLNGDLDGDLGSSVSAAAGNAPVDA